MVDVLWPQWILMERVESQLLACFLSFSICPPRAQLKYWTNDVFSPPQIGRKISCTRQNDVQVHWISNATTMVWPSIDLVPSEVLFDHLQSAAYPADGPLYKKSFTSWSTSSYKLGHQDISSSLVVWTNSLISEVQKCYPAPVSGITLDAFYKIIDSLIMSLLMLYNHNNRQVII